MAMLPKEVENFITHDDEELSEEQEVLIFSRKGQKSTLFEEGEEGEDDYSDDED